MPTPPKGAKWTEPPKVVTRLNYRSDRVGYTDECVPPHLRDSGRRRHARARSRTATGTTPAPAFSADGKWIAFSSLREPNAENAFRKSQIYAANVETGEIKQLTHRNGTNGSRSIRPTAR